jgi:hypothetical protein
MSEDVSVVDFHLDASGKASACRDGPAMVRQGLAIGAIGGGRRLRMPPEPCRSVTALALSEPRAEAKPYGIAERAGVLLSLPDIARSTNA